jgi:hypothetical protein
VHEWLKARKKKGSTRNKHKGKERGQRVKGETEKRIFSTQQTHIHKKLTDEVKLRLFSWVEQTRQKR